MAEQKSGRGAEEIERKKRRKGEKEKKRLIFPGKLFLSK
jgi:hypothetical protein